MSARAQSRKTGGRRAERGGGDKKLWKIESKLSSLADFRAMDGGPRISLEQYATSGHLAAQVVYQMHSRFDDVAGRTVIDLGCGPAILGLGAALLGARHVIGVDIYAPALAVAVANRSALGLDGVVDFVQADVLGLDAAFGLPAAAERDTASLLSPEADSAQRRRAVADTVITNPPFGTKKGNKGTDMLFLRQAAQLAGRAVYSFHKTATRAHIQKVAASWGLKAEPLAEMVFDLPKMYKAHRQASVDIRVDLWRFARR